MIFYILKIIVLTNYTQFAVTTTWPGGFYPSSSRQTIPDSCQQMVTPLPCTKRKTEGYLIYWQCDHDQWPSKTSDYTRFRGQLIHLVPILPVYWVRKPVTTTTTTSTRCDHHPHTTRPPPPHNTTTPTQHDHHHMPWPPHNTTTTRTGSLHPSLWVRAGHFDEEEVYPPLRVVIPVSTRWGGVPLHH